MPIEALLTLTVLLATVLLFVSERLPVDVVALLSLSALLLLGLVKPEQALSGFASEATVTVAAMFVLSAALSRNGALRVVSRLLSRLQNASMFTLVTMLCLAAMSAFVNNTAAVAVFLPVVLMVAARNRFSASKVLIPMSYAAQMGGVCTLIGTSTNLLVNSIAHDLGHPGFTLFEFAPLGLACAVAGVVYIMTIGRWLLPSHRQAELTDTYGLAKYITELRVQEGSPLIGQSVSDAKLGERFGVYVLELLRGEEEVWSPRAQKLQEGDTLLARGDWPNLTQMREEYKLDLQPEFRLRDSSFASSELVLTETMVAPGSRFAGHSLGELDFQWHYNASVLAIQRRSGIVRSKLRDVRLQLGDILLMLAPASEMPFLRSNANLIVLSEREDEASSSRRAWWSIAVMAGVVGAAALLDMPIVVSALIGCVALMLLRCIDPEDAYEAIDWRVIMLLAGVLPLGIALQQSGAASILVGAVLDVLGREDPLIVLAGIYLLTAVLTEAMSNNAAAVLLAPIAFASAVSLGVSPTPFLIAVAFAASTSFATPVGYQTNTMVYNVGGYRFSDFLRIGLPLNLLFWGLAVWLIPKIFPF
ncbi:SLC13 family permease [Pseudomarimonas arenosa]|uniref:SLC13 family permease n=1 Tax=Pseudomarimonas arenosa TaxID=2774145 RepID=A0AAW3ZM40_9GAMM|nr:SLC13 family permease [Pseudomarimonas arenosa]MBD8525476.1 SLC13 family permease [Pseudomarimonas arenosa]